MAKRSFPKPQHIKAKAPKTWKQARSSVFSEPIAATKKIFQIFAQRLAVIKSKDVLLLLGSIYAVYANYYFLWIGRTPDIESVWVPMAVFGLIAAVAISTRFWVAKFTSGTITKVFLWIRLVAPFCLIPLVVLYAQQRPSLFGYIALAIGALVSGLIAYQSVPLLFRSTDQ